MSTLSLFSIVKHMTKLLIYLQSPYLKQFLSNFKIFSRLRKLQIWGGGGDDVTSPAKSPNHYVDGGVSEPVAMMVQHNFGSSQDISSSCQLEV